MSKKLIDKMRADMTPKMIKNHDKFLEDVMVFVDRNGSIDSKTSNPMSCSLKMTYKSKDLKITMSAYSHGMGNGSCGAVVIYKKEVVYEASGGFTARSNGVKTKTYKSGPWEKLIGV